MTGTFLTDISLDCGLTDFSCHGKEMFVNIAEFAAQAGSSLIVDALTWWIHTPSVDPNSDAVHVAQGYTVPVIGLILMCSVLMQCLRMVISRRKEPAVAVALGLVRYFVVATIGAVVLASALQAGDALASSMVDSIAKPFGDRMTAVLDYTVLTNPFMLLFFGAIGLVLGAVQWLLAFLRQAALLVEAALLPVAASGSLMDSSRQWLQRLVPSLAALVIYKPIAALIYVIGFTFVGDGHDVSTALTGLMVIMLACVAMPAIMRLFSWVGVSIASGSGGGMAGAVGAASAAGSMFRHPAVQQASYLEATGPEAGSDGVDGADRSATTTRTLGPTDQTDSAGAAGAEAVATGGATAAAGAGAGGTGGEAGAAGEVGGSASGTDAAQLGAVAGPASGAVGQLVQTGYQASQSAAEGMTGGRTSDADEPARPTERTEDNREW